MRFIHYRVKTRNEYRLTTFPRDFLEDADPDDILEMTRIEHGAYVARVIHAGSTEHDQAQIDLHTRRGVVTTASPKEATESTDVPMPLSQRLQSGQGRLDDSEMRLLVERHAMQTAEYHFVELGYRVFDTSASEPYDLRCESSNVTKYVEVKGTASAGWSVIVTRNEVNISRFVHPDSVLFVQHSIGVSRARPLSIVHPGQSRIVDPWVPDAADLEPLRFRYSLPASR